MSSRNRKLESRSDSVRMSSRSRLLYLQHDRDRRLVEAVELEVLAQALERLEVLLDAAGLAVDDEHDRVRAGQHVLPHAPVLRLPWNREALDADLEALDLAEIDRQEVEQQRRVFLGLDRNQLHLVARAHDLVHDLQAGRLAAHAAAVVDELGADRLLGEVDEAHGYPGRPIDNGPRLSSHRSNGVPTGCRGPWPNPVHGPASSPGAAGVRLRESHTPSLRRQREEPPVVLGEQRLQLALDVGHRHRAE